MDVRLVDTTPVASYVFKTTSHICLYNSYLGVLLLTLTDQVSDT
jgi:hypothetical protein